MQINNRLRADGEVRRSDNGDIEWRVNGKLHSMGDKPALIDSYGDKYWYANDKLHRYDDKPAIECKNGDKEWYENNIRHRSNDLPSVVNANGSKIWMEYGRWHRLGGMPAFIKADGSTKWYIFGKLYKEKRVINYYKILAKFGRFCLGKFRLNRIKKNKSIQNELLCMPANSMYPGGQDYLQMKSYFMNL